MINDLVGHPAAVDGGLRLRARRTSTRRTSATSTTSSTNNRAQSVRRVRPDRAQVPGHPVGELDRGRQRGQRLLLDAGRDPVRPDEHAADCNVLQAGFSTLGLPVLDGSRSECDWQSSDKAVAPGHLPARRGADARPARLRHERQRQPLAVEPRGAAHRLRPHHRDRGRRADAADAARADPGRGPARRRPTACPATGSTASCSSRSRVGNRQYAGELWRDSVVSMCESAPGGFLLGSSGPVDVSGACEPLTAWDLHDNLDSNGAILFRRFASQILNDFTTLPTGLQGGTAPGQRDDLHDAVLGRRPGAHPERPQHGQPARPARARRRGLRPRGRRASRSTRRCADTSTRTRGGQKIPIHGGPGSLGVFNAINVSWHPGEGRLRRRRARLELHDGRAVRGREVPRARRHVRDLQPDREPALEARRRLHARVLEQALEPRAVLPRRGQAEDALDEARHFGR